MQTVEKIVTNLIIEKQELETKISRLEYFLITKDFVEISPIQQKLLIRQRNIMKKYNDVLIHRICVINRQESMRIDCHDCSSFDHGDCSAHVCHRGC